jgi:hypothetical protein
VNAVDQAGNEVHAVRLCDHPRASRQIELSRAWGGIASFLLVGFLALQANVPAWSAALRARAAGAIAYVTCWALAVLVWRHLALAETEAARVSAEQRRAALLEEIERRANAIPDPSSKP